MSNLFFCCRSAAILRVEKYPVYGGRDFTASPGWPHDMVVPWSFVRESTRNQAFQVGDLPWVSTGVSPKGGNFLPKTLGFLEQNSPWDWFGGFEGSLVSSDLGQSFFSCECQVQQDFGHKCSAQVLLVDYTIFQHNPETGLFCRKKHVGWRSELTLCL